MYSKLKAWENRLKLSFVEKSVRGSWGGNSRQPFCFFEESVASKFMETIGISLLGSCLRFLKRHLSVHLGK